jgi:SAM-dependent methyltransferase
MGPIASYVPAVGWFRSDETFNSIYPLPMQRLALRHWTPLRVTKAIVDFLTPVNDVSVLDIGSGVGKFCLAAAYYKPSAFFAGIEQRANLVEVAESVQTRLQLSNVSFHQGDFTNVDFSEYDHFYFFNSFYENLLDENQIDDTIEFSGELYNYYTRCLHKKLSDMPPGTRIVTYHSLEDEMPFSYRTVYSKFNNRLKFWVKDK